ncbi:unnamed protein product [Arctia plantaginis]|uniref:Cyclin-dependent kinase 2-interacting protein n=1 Tax=Arctia plantaginis TaxID=874455 RepID=A0A8S0YRZ2_ARCPL|nr:unnamed protein product [Arctia plantaginis]CAB3261483.1 unnamed protein product [Arctia plantaginis]
MSKTPTKFDSSQQFKAREISSTPGKDHQEIEKTVYSHVSNLHEQLCDWLKMKDKGIRIFKSVIALKLHECLDDHYPGQLKPNMRFLLDILENLKTVLDSCEIINDQLKALAKLRPDNEPAISTWSVSEISKNVIEILEALKKEYELKEVIIENVAHCRDEQLIDVYITAWEHDVYLHIDSFSYLFAEVGLASLP